MILMVNRITLLKELQKYPVFGVRIVSNLIDKGRNYSKLYIYRLKKAGLILELEKDRYTTHNDSLLVASHIVWPCYMSSWSAIRYYNLTEQLPNHIEVITTRSRKRRELSFRNTTIKFIRIKRENFFGFGKIQHGDFEIFIAEKEKALADALYLKHLSFETFIEILYNNHKELDVKKLKIYLVKMAIKNIAKKLKEADI